MKFNELNLTANRSKRRIGRGISGGQGKTAGRGTKGQNSRTGKGRRPGFEGGQNPLLQRLPKLPGFKSHRAETENIYTGQLSSVGTKIDNFTLFDAGLVTSPYVKVKLISKGDVSAKHSVSLQSASESAVAAIQKAGGSFNKSPQIKRLPKDNKSRA